MLAPTLGALVEARLNAAAGGSDLDARVWDAVVVGAGPAGALTAFELGRAGAEVLLLDRQAFPRWKVCGCCLSPGTQSVLHEAGLARILDGVGAVPLHTLRLAGWSSVADISLGPSVAMSRSALDDALVGAAVSAGVTFAAPARARLGPCQGGYRTLFVEVAGAVTDARARVVIAADGLGSPLLAEALHDGRDSGIAPWSRIGFGALFPAATRGYSAGVIHMALGPEGYVGLVRLEDGTLDVAGALDPAGLGAGTRPEGAVRSLLEQAGFPALDGTPTEGWRGTPRLTRGATTRGADRLLAVGDASGYVEPFTGEGMSWALWGARTLAPLALEGIRDWRPDLVREWDRRYEESIGAAARLCRGLSWALRRPALARRGLGVLSRLPFLAAPFVARAARSPSRPTNLLPIPPRRAP